jgi:hypothetical protein
MNQPVDPNDKSVTKEGLDADLKALKAILSDSSKSDTEKSFAANSYMAVTQIEQHFNVLKDGNGQVTSDSIKNYDQQHYGVLTNVDRNKILQGFGFSQGAWDGVATNLQFTA